MPDNPTTASPVRSKEDVAEAIQRTTDFIKSHGAELEYMDLHTILARLDFVERAATQGASLLKAHDVMKERLGNIFGPSLSLNEIMDKLEASQPKPQSDEGLRKLVDDALWALAEIGQLHTVDDHSDKQLLHRAMDIATKVYAKGVDARAALSQAPVPTSGAVEVAEAHKQIYAAVQTTLANCLPGMKEPTRQAAAVSLALKLRELFAKGVA